MKQRNALIAATLGEVVLLVAVLAGYLIAIATRLRKVSATLGKVTFGVRAIDKQTEPIGPRLREINGALEQVAGALQSVAAGGGATPDPAPDTGPAVPGPTTPT